VTCCNSNGALTAGQTIAVVVNDSLIVGRSFLLKLSKSGEARGFYGPRGGETSAAISDAGDDRHLFGFTIRNKWLFKMGPAPHTLLTKPTGILLKKERWFIVSDDGGSKIHLTTQARQMTATPPVHESRMLTFDP